MEATLQPMSLVQETLNICNQLIGLLMDENESLSTKDVKAIEGNLKSKSKLVAKLEKRLSEIKAFREEIKADNSALHLLNDLQDALKEYSEHARKNLIRLQALHQSTANFLNMVRETVASQRPQSNAYNKDGRVANQAPSTTIINKNI